MKIRKNDTVLVVKGKDKGKQAKVQHIMPDKGLLLVEGANMVKRHTKSRPGLRQAGIISKESPLHVSKVVLICTHCGKPARVGRKVMEDGTKARTCKKCHEVIE